MAIEDIPRVVREHYASVQSADSLQGALAWVDYRRLLAAGSQQRRWFMSTESNPLPAFWAEAIQDEGEWWPVRQVSRLAGGELRAYDWTYRDDADWGLPEVSVHMDPAYTLDCTRDEFLSMWTLAAGPADTSGNSIADWK